MSDDVSIYIALIAYKTSILVVGAVLSFMGYRLFLQDKIAPAGTLEGAAGKYKLKVVKAAPGIFFALFGAIIICASIFKGVHYSRQPVATEVGDNVVSGELATAAPVNVVIPDKPPH
jgi:hypothetical protein